MGIPSLRLNRLASLSSHPIPSVLWREDSGHRINPPNMREEGIAQMELLHHRPFLCALCTFGGTEACQPPQLARARESAVWSQAPFIFLVPIQQIILAYAQILPTRKITC